MLKQQQKLPLSSYSNLYDLLVPKDNILRKMSDLCDFSFIFEELSNKYCLDNGRCAIDPIIMFKYLVLKMKTGLSDVDLVEHTLYDLSFKYFLGLPPEATDLIHPTSLTKFRRQRLKDANLMQLLIGKTIQIAKAHGIKLSGVIIVDSTHTEACYGMHKPIEILRMQEKNLEHAMEYIDKDKYLPDMPKHENPEHDLEIEVNYCMQLIEYLRKHEELNSFRAIQERINNIAESLDDLKAEGEIALDKEARVGHKSTTHTFNGYKNHIAMDKDTRLVTAVEVTSGEVADGPQLQTLIEQTEAVGAEVKAIMGDTAYSSETNINLCETKGIPLYSKLHPIISDGTRKDDKGFFLNKDSGLLVCPHGEQALRKTECTNTQKNNGKVYHHKRIVFYFDVERCRTCPLREGCYKQDAKTKTYSITIEKDAHKKQRAFQETEEFKLMYGDRYQIEAKNGELKTCYGYDKAESYGLQRMQLQSAVSIFTCNLQRIIRLMK